MDRRGSMRLFLYIDKGNEVQKNKEVYLKMPRNLSANSSLQSILLKHQLALERAIRQLAQAVGNRAPEREEIAGFFQDLIDGGWDAYEEATAHESEELRKEDREILQIQGQIRKMLDGEKQVLFDRYEDLLNCRMTSELDQAYLTGYQTAIRFLLMGILPTNTIVLPAPSLVYRSAGIELTASCSSGDKELYHSSHSRVSSLKSDLLNNCP